MNQNKKPSLYDFEVLSLGGEKVSLSLLQGKILLIFNSAIHSSLASAFYPFLERIYLQHKRDGFEILDFPSNSFMGEAPESSKEIDEYCRKTFNTTFLRFEKIELTGENISPLFTYLCKAKRFEGFDKGNVLSPVLSIRYLKKGPGWEKEIGVKWNFTFFLVGRDGKVKKRLEATTSEEKIERSLLHLLDTEPLVTEEEEEKKEENQ